MTGPRKPYGPRSSKAERAWKLVNGFSFMDLREFLKLMFPDQTTDERMKMGTDLVTRMMKPR